MRAVNKVAGDLDKYMGAPYADEMRGIATLFGIPLADVVTMNLFYEVIISANVWRTSNAHPRLTELGDGGMHVDCVPNVRRHDPPWPEPRLQHPGPAG